MEQLSLNTPGARSRLLGGVTLQRMAYAETEKEMLAIVFGLVRFETYIYCHHIKVETDHKPLEVIHKKSVQSAPKHIQRMLLRTQKYEYAVVYKRGSEITWQTLSAELSVESQRIK